MGPTKHGIIEACSDIESFEKVNNLSLFHIKSQQKTTEILQMNCCANYNFYTQNSSLRKVVQTFKCSDSAKHLFLFLLLQKYILKFYIITSIITLGPKLTQLDNSSDQMYILILI